MRIAVVNTKGGTGKTSSSIMLAEAARRKGFTVAVIDADPQGSASKWAEVAEEAGDPLRFNVTDANRATLARKIKAANVGYLLIDTAPGDPAIIDAAVSHADLTIIPTRTTPADLDRALETYRALSTPAAILLWNVDSRHQLYKQARELFEEEEIVAFGAEIPTREEVNKMWFTSLDFPSLHGYEEVFAELHEALTTEGE